MNDFGKNQMPPELASDLLTRDIRPKRVARCQCITCERYLSRNRAADGSDPQVCEECRENSPFSTTPGIPLAKIRGPLTDPLSVEILGLLSEEAGEVVQRNGKISRWGWEADFEGTTQKHKLELELGDQLAAVLVAIKNNLVTREGVLEAMHRKLEAFREDAAGPRQRLQLATIPDEKDEFR